MPKYKVKVEAHRYQDLSDRAVERWFPIEANDEDDAVLKMRDLLDAERTKEGFAKFIGKNETRWYLGRVLRGGHAKLVK